MNPDRILVRAPTWIGDAVMATPVLRALRHSYPHAEIVVEGRPLLAELLAGLDSFDRFLPDPGGGAIAMVSRAARLRREHFDWAVLLPDSQRAALGPFLAGIPKRIGYSARPPPALAPHQGPGRAAPQRRTASHSDDGTLPGNHRSPGMFRSERSSGARGPKW